MEINKSTLRSLLLLKTLFNYENCSISITI